MFGNHIFNSPFVTQWVGDDLQNISAFYGGPSNELNWTFLNDRQSSSLWQGDDGTTQTLDAWENAYVVRTNPDGTLSAKPKYTSGLPEVTLRKVDTMSADEEETFCDSVDCNALNRVDGHEWQKDLSEVKNPVPTMCCGGCLQGYTTFLNGERTSECHPVAEEKNFFEENLNTLMALGVSSYLAFLFFL